MVYIHEMRAYGFARDETEYEVVGWIALDEDRDEPVMDIYTDPRMPVCGSNWSLRDTGIPVPVPGDTNVFRFGEYKV